jgi:hypothetical protein
MKIPLLEGRDLRRSDTAQNGALVNRAFAKEYFHGLDPVGKSFTRGKLTFQVVGLVANAQYRSMREPMPPVAYIPLGSPTTHAASQATFLVRTRSPNPYVLAPMLRHEVTRARPELRVSNVRTQKELNEAQTVRERLLAALAVFFAGVALLLAGIGLYGVLEYSVPRTGNSYRRWSHSKRDCVAGFSGHIQHGRFRDRSWRDRRDVARSQNQNVALSSEAKRCGYAGYSTADHCIDYSVISNTRYPSRNQNRSRRNAARRMISKVSIARNRTVLTGR